MRYILIVFLLCGCVSRGDVAKAVWELDKIPKRICDANPELYQIGIFRQLDNGKQQFVSYCSSTMKDYLAINKKDLEALLKKGGVKDQ